MSYICYFENSHVSSNKKEFLYIEDNQLVGTYNPEQAEKFTSKKEAEKWAAKFVYRADDVFYTNEIKEESIKFNEWISKAIYRKQPLVSEHSYKKTNETPEEIFDWWVEYHRITNDNSGSFRYEDYQTWNLYGSFQNIESTESHINHNTKKISNSISMSVEKDHCFNIFKAELSLALGFVTLTEKESNALMILITDHELCERNQYYLYVFPDNTYIIESDLYGHEKTKTLEEIFDYWKNNRPKTSTNEESFFDECE